MITSDRAPERLRRPVWLTRPPLVHIIQRMMNKEPHEPPGGAASRGGDHTGTAGGPGALGDGGERPQIRTPSPPAVHARDLTVVRGPRTVLDSLSFDVARGSVTGLLGPSGCGKSTLMRAIVGTQAKVTGTLDVLGREAG